jgi:hypothetical protein
MDSEPRRDFRVSCIESSGWVAMFKCVTWAIFNAVAITAATGTAVWLTITGHTLQIGGLLLAMGGVMARQAAGLRGIRLRL